MSDEEIRKIGEQFTFGVVFALTKWLIVASLVFAVVHCALPTDRDDTDPARGARSGLALRIDHGTGCQYLETKNGALLPRMGWNGRQICEASE